MIGGSARMRRQNYAVCIIRHVIPQRFWDEVSPRSAETSDVTYGCAVVTYADCDAHCVIRRTWSSTDADARRTDGRGQCLQDTSTTASAASRCQSLPLCPRRGRCFWSERCRNPYTIYSTADRAGRFEIMLRLKPRRCYAICVLAMLLHQRAATMTTADAVKLRFTNGKYVQY